MSNRSQNGLHHRIVIIGGGTAGLSVASRLRRANYDDIAILEPSEFHYYQPLWTLVGGGRAPQKESRRKEATVMPQGVHWIKASAAEIDPENCLITTDRGLISYEYLVVCPGIQLDWHKINGASDALGKEGVSSNYEYDLAPKTWEFIRSFRGGTAIFTMPSGPIKCAGAPQKIAYLAADYWRQQNLLASTRIVLVLPTPTMFGVPEFAKVLDEVVDRYGIEVRFQHDLREINQNSKQVTITNHKDGAETAEVIDYDLLHVVPPQSAPNWIKSSPLADPSNPNGYVEVHKHTMQHSRFPNIFALGDAGSTPNSKTGAAIRKQAPVVVANLISQMSGKPLNDSYDGYASCPITTARNKMLLAEFDYTLRPHPTIPLLNLQKERYDMWLLKRYGLPFMYWNLMLKGLA